MRLKDFLESENISVRQLAKEIGCHYQTIYNYIHHRKNPSPGIAQNIVEFSKGKVTLEELIVYRREIVRCPHCKQITVIKKDIVE